MSGDGTPGVRCLRVLRGERLTPAMRRLTLACEDVVDYLSGAMHLRLMVPTASSAGADTVARYYTVRRVDPARDEIVLDALLHAPAGPGSTWAATARANDAVAAVGPVGRAPPPDAPLVLVGDETALPMIARLIEEAAPHRRIDALIEVANRHEEQPVACGANARLTWLHRDTQGGSRLTDAATRLPWGEGGFLYAGVEGATADALRALAAARGAPATTHRIVTYWRRATGAVAA